MTSTSTSTQTPTPTPTVALPPLLAQGPVPGRLIGRAALITSATDPVGLRLAAHLHAEGARVGLLDPDGRGARAVAEQLGRGAISLVGDAACEEDMAGAIHRCRHAFGRLDLIVHVPAAPNDDEQPIVVTGAGTDEPDLVARSICSLVLAAAAADGE